MFLAGVALLGGGMRMWNTHQFAQQQLSDIDKSGAAEGVDSQLSAIDGARKGKAKRDVKSKSRSKTKRTTVTPAIPDIVDVDVASASQIEALPHIGQSLADRIVANRDSFGGFGSLDELARVRGVSKTLRNSIQSLVTFSGAPPRVSYADVAAQQLRDAKAAQKGQARAFADQRKVAAVQSAMQKAAQRAANQASQRAAKQHDQSLRKVHPGKRH